MGNTKNPYGKPVFDDIYSFPQDSQDAMDFADTFANVRKGTAAERNALLPGQRRAGGLWVETDTGLIFEDAGSAWYQRMAGPASVEANPGAAVPGITVPNTATSLPRGLIIKSGVVRATTTTAFGNEYMPRVVFADPFPTSLISLSIMQTNIASATTSFAHYATDDATKTGFRVTYPGTATTTVRGFMWTAMGN